MHNGTNIVRIAILDLYDGQENEGMQCIRDIIHSWGILSGVEVVCEEFDIRSKQQVPDISYDVFISTGGPGSPLESEGSEWEIKYFNWLQQVEAWNNNPLHLIKKHCFFICHSYQLLCRYYGIGQVCRRKSTSFGVFPVNKHPDSKNEVVFAQLKDPFYAIDIRNYQVIQPDYERLKAIGGKMLAIEKERPHVAYERAVMAVRFNDYFIGTQFHPEADAEGMYKFLLRKDKRKNIIQHHGEEKWKSMVEHLQDPDKILVTHNHILPDFLSYALSRKY